jgi:hypothetical protein
MDDPWPPRPDELAEWPIKWRARWGRLANELEDQGIPWPDHERQAFKTIKAEKEAESEDGTDIPKMTNQTTTQQSAFSQRNKKGSMG